MHNFITTAFQITLLIAVLLGFYIFVMSFILKKKEYNNLFNTWQFPMLLAIYMDSVYNFI